MKKIFTLLAAFAATAALNAASVTWTASSLSDLANNALLNDETFVINSNLNVSFEDGSCKEGNEVKFRKVTALTNPVIAFYSQNIMTITATNATITSVTFDVLSNDTNAGSDNTPGWSVKADGKTFNVDATVWEGSTTSLVVTGGSKASIQGLVIEYTATDSTDTPETGDDDDTATSDSLFFTEAMIGQGEVAQNITLTGETGVQVVFTSNSDNAQIDSSNGNFGTVDAYSTLAYRYRPGGKSSNGINSTNKGVFSFPTAGTLYIYAYNNQADDRELQLVGEDTAIIWENAYSAEDYVSPEGKNTKIYPVYSTDVNKGTAYLLWPTNQVMLYGFEFIPSQGGSSVVSLVDDVYNENAPVFDLSGRQVDENYKGIVIQNGKKFIRR